MREDMVDINGDHHSEKNGRYISKNGGESVGTTKTPKARDHISAYEITRIKNELKRRLVGRKTRTGLKITKIDPHAVIRAAQRDIWVDNIVDAVLRGERNKKRDRNGNYAFVHNNVLVGISPNGILKTVIYLGNSKKGKYCDEV